MKKLNKRGKSHGTFFKNSCEAIKLRHEEIHLTSKPCLEILDISYQSVRYPFVAADVCLLTSS